MKKIQREDTGLSLPTYYLESEQKDSLAVEQPLAEDRCVLAQWTASDFILPGQVCQAYGVFGRCPESPTRAGHHSLLAL